MDGRQGRGLPDTKPHLVCVEGARYELAVGSDSVSTLRAIALAPPRELKPPLPCKVPATTDRQSLKRLWPDLTAHPSAVEECADRKRYAVADSCRSWRASSSGGLDAGWCFADTLSGAAGSMSLAPCRRSSLRVQARNAKRNGREVHWSGHVAGALDTEEMRLRVG